MKSYKKLFNQLLGYFFITPAVVMLLFLVLIPTVQAIAMSFYEGDISNSFIRFVGLKNFIDIFQDERTINAMGRSLIFSSTVVCGVFIIGMSLALALNTHIRGRKLFRTMMLFPWVVSGVIAGVTWRWLMNTQYGFVNDVLYRLNLIDKPIEWLSKPNLAFISVIIATIWRSFPFVMLMLLAGLQSIDVAQYESADLDGANSIKKFWYITLPNLRPVSMPVFLTQVIWQLHNYDLIAAMTGVGPANSTETLPLNIYENAFRYFRFNYASAIGVVLLIFTLIFSIIYVKYYFKSLKYD